VQLPQTLVHWLLVASAASAIVFFCAGLTSFFEYSRRRPPWVVTIHNAGAVLSLAALAGVIFLPTRSDGWALAGIALYSVAVSVFLSAMDAARPTRLQRSFVDEPLPDRLITTGPYRWIRHPFYLGYILGALAAPVAIANPVMIVLAAMMIAITVAAAVREERVWLKSLRAGAYRDYKKQTGMFLPYIG
jgi:protein-S-isoprenylcysteine O-methyltransferase Ste14